MLLLHLIDEILQCGQRRLRVAGAAVEGRPVIKPVLPAEVQQRKPVAEHQQPAAACRHRVPERLIQRRQLLQIVRQTGPVVFLTGRVGTAQGVTDGFTQRLGQHR